MNSDEIKDARKVAGILAAEYGHSKLASMAVHAFMKDHVHVAKTLKRTVPPALLPLVVHEMEKHYHVCRTAGGDCDARHGVRLLRQHFSGQVLELMGVQP